MLTGQNDRDFKVHFFFHAKRRLLKFCYTETIEQLQNKQTNARTLGASFTSYII